MTDSWPDWTTPKVHGLPLDRERTVALTVNAGEDHPGATVVALKAQTVVSAYRHWDELPTLPVGALADLLRDAKRLADQANALVETLILDMRDHATGPASWATIGAALDVSRATVRERYQRIHAAGREGWTAAHVRERQEEQAADVLDRVVGNPTAREDDTR